jgi:hypothetical protein
MKPFPHARFDFLHFASERNHTSTDGMEWLVDQAGEQGQSRIAGHGQGRIEDKKAQYNPLVFGQVDRSGLSR